MSATIFCTAATAAAAVYSVLVTDSGILLLSSPYFRMWKKLNNFVSPKNGYLKYRKALKASMRYGVNCPYIPYFGLYLYDAVSLQSPSLSAPNAQGNPANGDVNSLISVLSLITHFVHIGSL